MLTNEDHAIQNQVGVSYAVPPVVHHNFDTIRTNFIHARTISVSCMIYNTIAIYYLTGQSGSSVNERRPVTTEEHVSANQMINMCACVQNVDVRQRNLLTTAQ